MLPMFPSSLRATAEIGGIHKNILLLLSQGGGESTSNMHERHPETEHEESTCHFSPSLGHGVRCVTLSVIQYRTGTALIFCQRAVVTGATRLDEQRKMLGMKRIIQSFILGS
jgi:hypothetical protein